MFRSRPSWKQGADGPAAVAVGELTELFPITRQAVSKHVAKLEDARLLHKSRVGEADTLAP